MKNEISAKQVGQNLIVIIDGKKIVKTEKDKVLRDALKEEIIKKANLYNKSGNDLIKDQLINLLNPEMKIKEVEIAKTKSQKKKLLKDEKPKRGFLGKLKDSLTGKPVNSEELIKESKNFQQTTAVEGSRKRGEY